MVDVVTLTIAIIAIITGILSHIRHSKCFGIDITTTEDPPIWASPVPIIMFNDRTRGFSAPQSLNTDL